MALFNSWTVYFNPQDFPGQYVARRFDGAEPTHDHYANEDITKVRDWVFEKVRKKGQGVPWRIDPEINDDPVIVEVWI